MIFPYPRLDVVERRWKGAMEKHFQEAHSPRSCHVASVSAITAALWAVAAAVCTVLVPTRPDAPSAERASIKLGKWVQTIRLKKNYSSRVISISIFMSTTTADMWLQCNRKQFLRLAFDAVITIAIRLQ